jgi:WD40 repeat protein
MYIALYVCCTKHWKHKGTESQKAMEHKDNEQPSLNHARQPHSLEQSTVPASLLPSVLSHLGLGDITSLSQTGVDKQLAALKDEEIPMRVAAVRSLGEQREASAIELLLAALHDPAWEVRAVAVWALGKFGEQAPLEALMRAANDADGSVRAAALRTLGLIGDRVSIEPLVQALDDTDWQVREIAVLTLGEHGEQAPLEPLLARLNDEYAAVREAARMALEQSHPEALSTVSSDPIVITQEPGTDTVFSVREQEQPRTGAEVEARAKVSSNGDSTLIQLTAHVRTLLSRVVRDVVTPLADTRSTFADDETSDIIAGRPGERNARRRPVRSKPRRLRRIAEGALAALIIAGIVASWLVIEQRLHPSQGSAPLLAYHGHADGPAAWSSDSKYVSFLADSIPTGEAVLVWNRATGQLTKHILHTLLPTQAQQPQGGFAPDGKHLAFAEIDTHHKVEVQVWDVIAWRRILTTSLSSPSGYLNVYWSPDSTRFVVPGEDGTIQVWNVATGHELVVCPPVPLVEYLPENIFMSPDGHSLLYGGHGQQKTYVLNITSCKYLTLPSSDSSPLVWSPQGNRFASISSTDPSMVQVWDAHTGRNLASFHLTAAVSEIVWAPDGTRIVASGYKEVDVLDVAAQRIVLKVIPARIDLLPVWAVSPDGKTLASLNGTDTVQLWDAVTGHKLNVYQSPGNSVKVMAWSPDSSTLATGSTDGIVRVWKGDTVPETYHSGSSAILNIVWSPDGKSIAAGDIDGNIWTWQVN